MNRSQYGTASNNLLAQIDSAMMLWIFLCYDALDFPFQFQHPSSLTLCVYVYIGSLESMFQNMWSIPLHDHLRWLGSLSLRCPPNNIAFSIVLFMISPKNAFELDHHVQLNKFWLVFFKLNRKIWKIRVWWEEKWTKRKGLENKFRA